MKSLELVDADPAGETSGTSFPVRAAADCHAQTLAQIQSQPAVTAIGAIGANFARSGPVAPPGAAMRAQQLRLSRLAAISAR